MQGFPRILPHALQRGDTIGIISPSWFGGSPFIPRAKRGIATLNSAGFRTRIGSHAFNNRGAVSDTAENRAANLHDMFEDDGISAILCSIGGDHSNQLLPLIDWERIRKHPKVFIGASDITVLNLAIWKQTGLVTFNGPTLLTEWSEFPRMPEFSHESAMSTLTIPAPYGTLHASQSWTDEFLDWTASEHLSRRRAQRPSEGWKWIREGNARGPLIGVCLESMEHLRGTRFWPDMDGAMLFLETSEACPSPDTADAILMDYENMGVFDAIAGLLIARPYGMTPEDHERFWEVVDARTCRFHFPVVGNLDFGHTSPQLTLPIGIDATIDSIRKSISIDEAAVAGRKTQPEYP